MEKSDIIGSALIKNLRRIFKYHVTKTSELNCRTSFEHPIFEAYRVPRVDDKTDHTLMYSIEII